ncbi:ribosomal RNA small subunit methyltransferase B [Lactobacillus pasteurii DSM 23907 = CRBIP 24.76]|uniref:16S rRNA (cytosine(967)-C(5))-methyltransferase n=1 Tax=Lactobacillus pasteurii DSM 23907 = CRBIP 24.76 TaxID=1423790 RepID=I7JYP7_9LACO|nr:16S rRNA (cytosine(967)-C(5))-methyltransferase RsmB [Lactobacillus pasteurii]KRK08403.1 ribosomal RNA small subunit methyltransferase B [Lactobacillus pasteurii DSM 23907 = CRBIP 24.76]TDG75581.1 hypothetical protein C5L33_000466 [Lactobacillus pasteurii]CCI85740.1 Ribosomal RNA small subunit methyltransferase B [Lactobacillus pasteurii DSM 23907 = CRBIP 24.76]
MTKNTARSVALDILINILTKNSYSNISLNHSLENAQLSQADQNLATNIVYGTIQHRIFLEYQLKDLIQTKLTEKHLMPLLLMSAYQIIFLDKVPARAVLDEANKLAKSYGSKRSNGYRIVNGVLRSLTRRGVVLPDDENSIEYLSVKESMPQWLVEYFVKEWGRPRAQAMFASFNETAKNSIRVSSLADQEQVFTQLTQLGYEPVKSDLSPSNLILKHGGVIKEDLFKNGDITIQDEAAGLVVQAFDFKGDEQVLDACSAPGGKTVQIAEHLTTGQVTALDIHKNKLNLVKKNAQRMKVADKLKVAAIDARASDSYFSDQRFDKILVDAPCSGLGLMRRKPEIRYTKKPEDLVNLQKIQLAILDHVSQLLNKGGELVYSTCTISRQEDEDVIEKFLMAHPAYSLEKFEVAKLKSDSGMLKILPDEFGSDGFFIAKLKLRG